MPRRVIEPATLFLFPWYQQLCVPRPLDIEVDQNYFDLRQFGLAQAEVYPDAPTTYKLGSHLTLFSQLPYCIQVSQVTLGPPAKISLSSGKKFPFL